MKRILSWVLKQKLKLLNVLMVPLDLRQGQDNLLCLKIVLLTNQSFSLLFNKLISSLQFAKKGIIYGEKNFLPNLKKVFYFEIFGINILLILVIKTYNPVFANWL